MQSTSGEMPGWANHKLESNYINYLTYTDDTTLMEESKEELKCLLVMVEEESGKAELKFNIQETNIMVSGPINSWQVNGE